MPFKRKRDWPQRAFSYWAQVPELPQHAWDHARAMQGLWNTLCDLREQCSAEAKDLEPEARKARWSQFWLEARAAEKASGLGWESGPFVFDRFSEAHRRTGKAVGGRPAGAPQKQHGLRAVRFFHRFTGGGVPTATLFSPRATRVHLTAPAPESYQWNHRKEIVDCSFAIGKEQVPIHVILHRPLPPDAIVKSALLSGKKHPLRGWQWSLTITVEEPPPPAIQDDPRPICGLDLGWRAMEGYIRIGYIVDSLGNAFELRLIDGGRHESERRRLWGKEFKTKRPYLSTFRDILALDEEIGKAVEACKEELRKVCKKLPPGFTQMRQSGLVRWLRELEQEEGFREEEQVLKNWLRHNDTLRRIRDSVSTRLVHYRRYVYRNIAKWITTTYRTIAWEKDLSVKVLKEADKGDSYALEAADRYAQWAAIGELRLYIKQAAVRYQSALADGIMQGSTSTCWECGGKIKENEAALVRVCENEHEHDQDYNAAQNLLRTIFSQQTGVLEQDGAFRKIPHGRAVQGIEIPVFLKAVAVNVYSN